MKNLKQTQKQKMRVQTETQRYEKELRCFFVCVCVRKYQVSFVCISKDEQRGNIEQGGITAENIWQRRK